MAENPMDELIKKSAGLSIQQKDEDYYGLQCLDPNTVLYRVCRYDEDTGANIVCQAKTPEDEKRTVNQHINSGSKKPSRFISSTASLDKALEWAFYTKETPAKVEERPGGPQPIIKIYLSKMTGMQELKELINLTNEKVVKHFVKGATQIARVKSSKEVLFQWRISKKNSKGENVFELLPNPQKPSKPK